MHIIHHNFHVLRQRDLPTGQQVCHTDLCNGRESRLYSLKLRITLGDSSERCTQFRCNLISQRIGDNHKCACVFASERTNIPAVEIMLLINFRHIADSGQIVGNRICPAVCKLGKMPVLVESLHINDSLFQLVLQDIVTVSQSAAERIMEMTVVAVHLIGRLGVELPDSFRLNNMETGSVDLIELLQLCGIIQRLSDFLLP